jgi:putative addiction module component (TIGR02574 family)
MGPSEAMSVISELLNRALELPKPERADLARQILLSLEPDDFHADSDAAWAAEIDARLDIVERGDFPASEWRDVIARIRQSLTEGRKP